MSYGYGLDVIWTTSGPIETSANKFMQWNVYLAIIHGSKLFIRRVQVLQYTTGYIHTRYCAMVMVWVL